MRILDCQSYERRCSKIDGSVHLLPHWYVVPVSDTIIIEGFNDSNLVWSGPFQIVIALVLLYQTMGPSIWAGVAVLILAIPLNTYIAKKMRTMQKIQMGNKDTRVKLMVKI